MPRIRTEDKVRIKEAMRISELFGEKIWRGIQEAPFALLLVTDSIEFLTNHPAPSKDFLHLGYDAVLGSQVYYRKTVFNKSFLATFPAVNGINTIVVGTPENTGTNTNSWILSILHEHFHQFVYSGPDYYDAVHRLDLSDGDQTGMWMLNYPFPYSDSAVVLQYRNYTRALSETLSRINSDSLQPSVLRYVAERKKLQQLLKPAEYRYFSFQIWQEGIARYTEFKFLDLLDKYEPSKEVSSLQDYVPFEKYRETFYQQQVGRITQWDLSSRRRDCFYALGFGEGLVLDKQNPQWREKYLTDKFYIEQYSSLFR
ncbi:MAG: hypothetical protein AABZ41_03205 [Bacteroidota bacterium]